MTADELPDGWAESKMGDIATVVGGGTPTANEPTNFAEHGIAWITPADLSDFAGVHLQHGRRFLTEAGYNACSAKLLPKGAVLMSSRAPIGYVAIAANELCTNQGFKSFVLKPCVLPEFAFHWLRFMRDEIEDMGSGSTFLEVSGSKCKEIPIRFPPLAEQRRIVSAVERILDKVTAARARLDRVPTTLKRFRQAVLAAACSGRLTADWRKQNPSVVSARDLLKQVEAQNGVPSPVSPKDADMSGGELVAELPVSWAWSTLTQVGQRGRPIIYGIIKPGPHDPNGVPYVRVTEMKDGYVDVANLRKASRERADKFKRATLAAGDLLISKDGTIGCVAVVPPELAGGNITQHVVRAAIHPLLNRDYFVFAVRSPFCQNWLRGETLGVALQGVNVEDFRRLPVPVPPLAEQQEIVKRVSALFARADAIEAAVTAARKRVDTLTQAVLAKAFRGELVPTEAELARRENRPYEPAADLLARVRASAATPAAKPTRTRKPKP